MSDDERWMVTYLKNDSADKFELAAWFTTYAEAIEEYKARSTKNGYEVYLFHVSRKKPRERKA